MRHPLQQLRATLARSEADVLAALREQQLLASPDIEKTQLLAADDLVRDFPSVLLHLDPQRPHDVAESRVAGLYANDAIVNTEGSPPYLRLPSFPDLSPYLILWFFGLPLATPRTAAIDMQVFTSGGSVRVTATGNPSTVLVTESGTGGARVTVPVTLTPTSDGFASLLLQRVEQTGFDWNGVDLF